MQSNLPIYRTTSYALFKNVYIFNNEIFNKKITMTLI